MQSKRNSKRSADPYQLEFSEEYDNLLPFLREATEFCRGVFYGGQYSPDHLVVLDGHGENKSIDL